jgi:adenine C2-methylase RlmN of 23S rRNA A2503 and tRNA A37
VTVRDTRGRQIDGACGQLAASNMPNDRRRVLSLAQPVPGR